MYCQHHLMSLSRIVYNMQFTQHALSTSRVVKPINQSQILGLLILSITFLAEYKSNTFGIILKTELLHFRFGINFSQLPVG